MNKFIGLPWGLDYCKCGKIKLEKESCCVKCKKIYNRKLKIERINERNKWLGSIRYYV